jgi:two-component system, response regulator PdtaR
MRNNSRTRVLIADDDGLVAMVIQFMLEDKGYEVVGIAGDGHAAVECVVDLRPDVVLMDLGMPELDGIEATRRIMRLCPVPIIALTAYGGAQWREKAFEAGMVDFLVKPASAQDMADAITLAQCRTLETSRVDPDMAWPDR